MNNFLVRQNITVADHAGLNSSKYKSLGNGSFSEWKNADLRARKDTSALYQSPLTGTPTSTDQPLIYRTSDSDPSINPCIIPRYNQLSTTNRLSSIAPNTGDHNKSRLVSISTRSVISFKDDRRMNTERGV